MITVDDLIEILDTEGNRYGGVTRNPTLTGMVGMHHRGFGLSNLSGVRSRKEKIR